MTGAPQKLVAQYLLWETFEVSKISCLGGQEVCDFWGEQLWTSDAIPGLRKTTSLQLLVGQDFDRPLRLDL